MRIASRPRKFSRGRSGDQLGDEPLRESYSGHRSSTWTTSGRSRCHSIGLPERSIVRAFFRASSSDAARTDSLAQAL